MKRRLRAPSPALVIALIALFIALGGTTYAATSLPKNSVGTKQLKKNAVTGAKIKNHAVTAAKINASGLTVPNAAHATSADSATNATNATNANHATTAGSAPPSGIAGGALTGSYPNPGLAAPEAYHEVGASGEPAFQNSWVNEVPGSESTAGFYEDSYSVVHLKGIVTGGTGTIFDLPAADRPTKYLCISTYRGGAAYICIEPDNGAVYQAGGASTGSLLLDGITFRAGAG